MAISKQDQQHWITVATDMVTEFVAAREQAAQTEHDAAPSKKQPKRAATAQVQPPPL